MNALQSSSRSWLVALLVLVGSVGCDLNDPCDPGQVHHHGLCIYPPVAEMDGGDDEDDAGALSDANTDANTDPFAGYGTACTEQTLCATFGLVCGESFLPYCTRTNCLGIANGCPPSWTCLDTRGLSPDPSVTSICLQP